MGGYHASMLFNLHIVGGAIFTLHCIIKVLHIKRNKLFTVYLKLITCIRWENIRVNGEGFFLLGQ